MSDRRPYRHHHQQQQPQPQNQQQQTRFNFDDRCRTLEDELKRKNDMIESLR